jgi:hypothetical protein
VVVALLPQGVDAGTGFGGEEAEEVIGVPERLEVEVMA